MSGTFMPYSSDVSSVEKFPLTTLCRAAPSLSVSVMFPHFLNSLLVALGLCCCVSTLSSCRERGQVSNCSVQASHCGGFSCCGARALGVQVQKLGHMGVVALQHVGSSQTRDPLHWQADLYPLHHQRSPVFPHCILLLALASNGFPQGSAHRFTVFVHPEEHRIPLPLLLLHSGPWHTVSAH